jgi:hypothetical protein
VHGLNQRIIFIQHPVEKTDELIEFTASGSGGDPAARIACLENISYRLDQLPDWAHGAEGQKATADNAEQEQWEYKFKENRSKVGQKLLAAG